ncbi:endonuclease V [Vulcanisaeta distributa]|uniref:endonuclease V n=1 Tax=Vulcanisaeta distributa TaxID=164451 RepID=UPI0006D16271|nr:endonuclease V [Vulcanisaeta distributa]
MRVSRGGPNEGYVRSRVPRGGFRLETARSIQRALASRVIEEDLLNVDDVDLVSGGIDVAYINHGDAEIGISVASTYSLAKSSIIEWSCWVGPVTFPYVPTLLSFRELKPVVNAYLRLRTRPQVVLIDGHGRAHPYRLGIASHFGVCMRVPTIGVAKSLLYGKVDGGVEGPILDIGTNEVIGWAIQCAPSKPTYVSVGYGISLRSAVNLIKRLCVGSQMPIPILHSHNTANNLKRRITKRLSERSIEELDNECKSSMENYL